MNHTSFLTSTIPQIQLQVVLASGLTDKSRQSGSRFHCLELECFWFRFVGGGLWVPLLYSFGIEV